MKRASITEAKNRLSALLEEVKAGETVVILERGVPIAKIEGIAAVSDGDARIARLERAGIIRPPRGKGAMEEFLKRKPVKLKSGASVLEALLEERREGR